MPPAHSGVGNVTRVPLAAHRVCSAMVHRPSVKPAVRYGPSGTSLVMPSVPRYTRRPEFEQCCPQSVHIARRYLSRAGPSRRLSRPLRNERMRPRGDTALEPCPLSPLLRPGGPAVWAPQQEQWTIRDHHPYADAKCMCILSVQVSTTFQLELIHYC